MLTNLPTHIKEQISDMKKDEEKVHVNPDNIYLIISYDSKKEDSTIFIHLKQ